MENSVKIISEKDSIIIANDNVKQFINNQKGQYVSLFVEDAHIIAVKESVGKTQTLDQVRSLAGNISRQLSNGKSASATLDAAVLKEVFTQLNTEQAITAFAEGWELGAYQFISYKSDAESMYTELMIEKDGKEADLQEGKIRAEAVAFSRDLMNEVPNVLHPESFPSILQQHFKNTGVKVNILNKQQLEKMEMNGVLTVGRGSKYKPAFAELKYEGDSSKPLVALVGKGVTFDTGGISLKSGKDLSDMRMDMGGAAAVAGALTLLAKSKANVNVIGLIPIVENTPDNEAVLPGEVIHYKNGLTVQVGNTDAEGRLILADGLIRAEELKAEYIIDIATLTGSIVSALGTEMAGVFGDEEMRTMMHEIGKENGDFNWPMPLVDTYDETLASDYADFNNISSMSEAGSITAALFLRRFVAKDSKWLHVDMAGTMDKNKNAGYYTKAATGFGARLLADFAIEISK